MESKTFGRLLQQAEQMAQEYAELKEKYNQLKCRYRDLCIKYEKELKDIAVLLFEADLRIESRRDKD